MSSEKDVTIVEPIEGGYVYNTKGETDKYCETELDDMRNVITYCARDSELLMSMVPGKKYEVSVTLDVKEIK